MRMSILLLLILGLPGCGPSSKETSALPNILLFLADDWSWPHAGVYGDSTVSTPNFDRLAGEGLLFTNAYCATPSCSASRAALLTGRYPHQLEQGANLWGFLPNKFPNYASILADRGYLVGHERKGWGPGDHTAGGYEHNPAGKGFKDFKAFYDSLAEGQPFCFWFGSLDPHRSYKSVEALQNGKTANNVMVPAFLPDVPEVQQDILNYYAEVERFDRETGEILSFLEKDNALDNTLIVITSDNGMPFPRAKATLYDAGMRMPLIIAWKDRIKQPTVITSFVSLIDLAPTFLKATGTAIPTEMMGKDLLDLIDGKTKNHRENVFLERERHAYVRNGNASYPARAVRNHQFLYIKNLAPELWPAGEPELVYSVGPFGDVDSSPSKDYILINREQAQIKPFYQQAFDKRQEEELYDLKADPHQLINLALNPEYQEQKKELDSLLETWRQDSNDPRSTGEWKEFENYPYFGNRAKAHR